MFKEHLLTGLSVFVLQALFGGTAIAENPRVALDTSEGRVVIELNAAKAPISVKNFLDYVKAGYFEGTVFHRVIPGFMVQGGGFTPDLKDKPGARPPIKNEADNGLLNKRGTLAMARTADVNSATTQFFVNLKDNAFLDNGKRDFGYAVFGEVVEGMDTVDKIAKVPTGTVGMYENVPKKAVIITSAKLVEK